MTDRRRHRASIAAAACAAVLVAGCGTTVPTPTGTLSASSASPTANSTTSAPASIPVGLSPSAPPDLASLSWHRLADTGQFSDPVGSVMITGLTALPDGSILAIGNGPAGGVVWRSADGVAWQRDPPDAALRLAHLLNVVTFGGAVGLEGDIVSVDGKVRPGLWSSVDGLRWTAIPLPAGYTASGPLTAAGDRLYLAGDSTSSSGELMPALWTSADARTWARVDDASIQDAVVEDVANGPAGPVIVGTVESQGSVFATAWHSTAGGLAAVTMSEPSALASSVDQVVATSTGYIATGSQTIGDPNATPTAALWRSSDGVSWVESHAGIPDGAVLGPVATDGTSVVVEGNLDERPGLWASTDRTAGACSPRPTASSPGGSRLSPRSWRHPDGFLRSAQPADRWPTRA